MTGNSPLCKGGSMKSIKDIISNKKLVTVKTGTNIHETVLLMSEHNIGLVPILADDGKLIGVFSERDLLKRVIAKGLDLKSTAVDSVMTKELLLADINESHQQCLKKMQEKVTRHILVVENDKLAGILSMRDLLQIDIEVHQETIEVLHKYIYST